MIRLWDWVLKTIAGDWDHLDFDDYTDAADDDADCGCDFEPYDTDEMDEMPV